MAVTNICILKYNNYFNRKVLQPTLLSDGTERYNSLGQYVSATGVYYETQQNTNFYKNDNVTTEILLNTYKDGVDYLVEYSSDSPYKILSRWFVIENQQVRAGQSMLKLRRDIMVDYKDDYVDAPAFIEKGYVNPNDIAIYNKEDISFNQIKKTEKLIKDASGMPWIVGYIAPNATAISASTPANGYRLFGTYSSKDAFKTAIGMTNNVWQIPTIKSYEFRANTNPGVLTQLNWDIKFKVNGQTISIDQSLTGDYVAQFSNITSGDEYAELSRAISTCILPYTDELTAEFIESSSNYHADEPLVNQNDILIYVTGESKYYSIHVAEGTATEVSQSFAYGTDFWNVINNALNNSFTGYSQNATGSFSIKPTVTLRNFSLTFTEVTLSSYHVSIPTTANQLIDAPYKMFALPIGTVSDEASHHDFSIAKDVALAIASAIATAGSSNIYDIQLLPYCPCINWYDGLTWRTDELTLDKDYSYITDGNSTNLGVIFFPTNSSFTNSVDLEITNSTDPIEKKVTNQCDSYRLVSPNLASIFEFNPVVTGDITKILISCTYKPYNPFVHLRPNWQSSSLYGFNDRGDERGLIFQGDFSLPIMNDQWKQYQINNKNYQNSFNRQIESIELQNKYQKTADVINAITGSFTGAAAGAFTGAQVGGVGGAIGGALFGAAASGVGGALDVDINEKLRRDSLNLQRDQFNYSLQNIQSLPYTLAKVSAFDINNRIFPILEYYTCTDQEKDIFKSKLTYNGMTVMRIDKLSNFVLGSLRYFKGQFIRLDDISDDYHLCNELANEFYKGVFI